MNHKRIWIAIIQWWLVSVAIIAPLVAIGAVINNVGLEDKVTNVLIQTGYTDVHYIGHMWGTKWPDEYTVCGNQTELRAIALGQDKVDTLIVACVGASISTRIARVKKLPVVISPTGPANNE